MEIRIAENSQISDFFLRTVSNENFFVKNAKFGEKDFEVALVVMVMTSQIVSLLFTIYKCLIRNSNLES